MEPGAEGEQNAGNFNVSHSFLAGAFSYCPPLATHSSDA
jgi:hypothetical protein